MIENFLICQLSELITRTKKRETGYKHVCLLKNNATHSESVELTDNVLFGVGKNDRLFTADTGVPIDDTLLSLKT